MLLVGAILTPVVLLLLFVYILGGPIGNGLGAAARGEPYVDFLVPGIVMMTVAAGSAATAINVCTDMTGGIIDRFRTMAVTRGAVLTGHVTASVLRTLVATTVVTGVALLVGFRPRASVADWLAVVGVVTAFAFALAWLSAALGLMAKTAGANGSTLPIQFLLPRLQRLRNRRLDAGRHTLVQRKPAVHRGGGQPARAADRRADRPHRLPRPGLVRGDGRVPVGAGRIRPWDPVRS